MASKNQVRVGDVWADSKGRRLRVVGALDTRGKVPLLNVATNRPINSKGPRALVRQISQGEGPKITRAANPAPPPFPAMPATRPAPSRGPRPRPAPAQPAAGSDRRLLQRPAGARPRRLAPSATPPLHFGAETARFNRPNPASYPSPIAQAVAEAMAGLSRSQANDPQSVLQAAMEAVSGFARNPHGPLVPPVFGSGGDAGYAGQYGGLPLIPPHHFSSVADFGREHYQGPEPTFAPPPHGYPGQYGHFTTHANPYVDDGIYPYDDEGYPGGSDDYRP